MSSFRPRHFTRFLFLIFGISCACASPCEASRVAVDGVCMPGFELNPDGLTCHDIDQCVEGSHGCSHVCNNYCGGYSCSCPGDMMLGEDGRTCFHPPVHCLGSWGPNSSCTTTCGCGLITRVFHVSRPSQHGGLPCIAKDGDVDAFPCRNSVACPVDFEVGPWVEEECNATCGTDAYQRRSRDIIREATYPGSPVPVLEEFIRCDVPLCPVDCVMGQWAGSGCSATCGNGTQRFVRSVIVNSANGGVPCGETERVEPCFLKHCPVSLRVWKSTRCAGGNVDPSFLSDFGASVDGSDECRSLPDAGSTTDAMALCAQKCRSIDACAGYEWLETARVCCFRANTSVKTSTGDSNTACFEALPDDGVSSPHTYDSGSDPTYFTPGSVFLAIFLVAASMGAFSTFGGHPNKQSEYLRSPTPPAVQDLRQADPATPGVPPK